MNRLTVKRLRSIGAVPDGDNPEAEIMLFKRAPQDVSKLSETNPDRGNNQEEQTMSDLDLSQIDKELAEQIQSVIKGLEDRIGELETPEVDDVTKGMPDEVKAQFAELQKAHEATAAALEKERNERLTVEMVGRARAFEKVLGDAEEAAPQLRSMPDESVSWLFEKLAAVERALEKSDLFKELGSGDDGQSAIDKLNAEAAELRKQNPKLTAAQARVMAREGNPDLAEAEKAERGL